MDRSSLGNRLDDQPDRVGPVDERVSLRRRLTSSTDWIQAPIYPPSPAARSRGTSGGGLRDGLTVPSVKRRAARELQARRASECVSIVRHSLARRACIQQRPVTGFTQLAKALWPPSPITITTTREVGSLHRDSGLSRSHRSAISAHRRNASNMIRVAAGNQRNDTSICKSRSMLQNGGERHGSGWFRHQPNMSPQQSRCGPDRIFIRT